MLTDRERLLLKFNDNHVIDSDSSLMGEINSDDKDTKDKSKIRQDYLSKLESRRQTKKCAMIKMLDESLEENVGRYRHSLGKQLRS